MLRLPVEPVFDSAPEREVEDAIKMAGSRDQSYRPVGMDLLQGGDVNLPVGIALADKHDHRDANGLHFVLGDRERAQAVNAVGGSGPRCRSVTCVQDDCGKLSGRSQPMPPSTADWTRSGCRVRSFMMIMLPIE